MTTTALHIMHALGWQGGTIHQVASATGLKVETVLNLSDYKVEDSYQLQSYTGGFSWALVVRLIAGSLSKINL